ncbi:hypothetical protein H4R18_002672 [Coemansia javaensis]|uniref:Mis12-domain-containing protein n=1 Tax=Coemansia javaensis TaxID=2761396 RepID=A0A9W8LJI6_9FUNG|nr:hypothetical protein H4R18_002672 [Coemansia javaensis]
MDAVQSEGGPVATEPADGSGLGGIIAGATPVRHSEAQQQQRRVYPPSDSAQSLIVEHFGFLPIAFIDEIINAANDTVYRATDALCKFVEKEQGGGEATSQAINKAETLLEHAVDKNFDKFELYALRNLFNMPQGLEDYVAMLHRSAGAADEAPVEAADEAALDRALDEVRRELTATRLARTRAQHDTARVERGVRRLRTLNEHLRIDELWRRAPGGGGDVAAAAAAARAQVAEVARLVAQLDADDPERRLSPMDVLKEPSGRDVYLAHMANVQVAAWAAQQAPPMQQPN